MSKAPMTTAARPGVEAAFGYPFTSHLAPGGLTLAVCGGEPDAFAEARVAHADRFAQLLLVVADVAARRFYLPPGMVARVLREADPVVTAGAGAVQFESFSPCSGRRWRRA